MGGDAKGKGKERKGKGKGGVMKHNSKATDSRRKVSEADDKREE